MTEPIVNGLPTFQSLTTRSALVAPSKAPPAIEAAPPVVMGINIPPVAMVKVTPGLLVREAARILRELLVALAATGAVGEALRLILLVETYVEGAVFVM